MKTDLILKFKHNLFSKDIWSSAFKNKGDIMSCGNYRGIIHSIYEGVLEHHIQETLSISEEQLDFMKANNRPNICTEATTGEV